MNTQHPKYCKYCRLEYPAQETRCGKCHAALDGGNGAVVLMGAALPEIASPPIVIAPQAPPPPQGLRVATANPRPHHRVPRVSERQRDLFPVEERPKVVALPGTKKPASDGKRAAPRRRTNPNQYSFEFVAMPAPHQPLRREFDSAQSPFRVAPMPLRAMSAVFDAGMVGVMLALFAATLHYFGRWVIGESLLRPEWWPQLAASPLLLALAYKLLWCLARRDTIGIQAMGLVLVSFDGTAPSPAQRICRLLTGWLSFGAGGLGLFWALADQEQLTWHDHASQTFLTLHHRDE